MKTIGNYDSSLRLEETVLPSFNSIDLRRTVETDYYNRFSSRQAHIAELFHQNSKLSPHSTMEVPVDRRPFDDAREWYFKTTYKLKEDDFHQKNAHLVRMQHNELPSSLRSLVASLANPEEEGNLLNGLDVFLLIDRTFYRIIPDREFIWIERKLTDNLSIKFKSAFMPGQQSAINVDDCYLFLACCFWRYQMFYGPRGYRMALMDAGRLMRYIEEHNDLFLIESFYDNQMDDVLLLDGVERSILNLARLEV